jgi:hypothetical protein
MNQTLSQTFKESIDNPVSEILASSVREVAKNLYLNYTSVGRVKPYNFDLKFSDLRHTVVFKAQQFDIKMPSLNLKR